MKIVVVGYGPGGAAAAFTAKTFDKSAEVAVLTDETHDAHRRPGVAMALESPWPKELTVPQWSLQTLAGAGIKVKTGVTVVGGSVEDNRLDCRAPNGSTFVEEYDRLILALGGVPALPPIPGVDLDGVFTIRDIRDASRAGEYLAHVSTVAVIGAGYIGLEMAERLKRMGKTVHLVVRSRLMRRLLEVPLSEDLAARVAPRVHLHLGRSPEAIVGEEQARCVVVGGDDLDVDAVLCVTGLRPNTALAKELGLELGPAGGVLVDEQMRTSVENVFAVGDCAEIPDALTGKPVLLPVASAAARGGRQAAVAALGRRKRFRDVSLRLQYDRVFETDVLCVGYSSTVAASLGVETDVEVIEDTAEMTKVALVTTKEGRLVGGQVIASRMASVVGLQLYKRVLAGVTLEQAPLLDPVHDRIRRLLEQTYGPIR